jgi:hypothetical protein
MPNRKGPLKVDDPLGIVALLPIEDYATMIQDLEQSIKQANHQIQIAKTLRKLAHLKNGGELCSTCNGILVFRYGNAYSDHFWAQCENCKQTNLKRAAEWSDNPEEWPEQSK